MSRNVEQPVAIPRTALIVALTKLNGKWFRAAALAALLWLGAGCSGIHASKSISPLDFLLPGIMKNETPAERESFPTPAPALIADARG